MSFLIGLGTIALALVGAARLTVLTVRGVRRGATAVRGFVSRNVAGLRRKQPAARRGIDPMAVALAAQAVALQSLADAIRSQAATAVVTVLGRRVP